MRFTLHMGLEFGLLRRLWFWSFRVFFGFVVPIPGSRSVLVLVSCAAVASGLRNIFLKAHLLNILN